MRPGLTDMRAQSLRPISSHCGQCLWPCSQWEASLAPSRWGCSSTALEGKLDDILILPPSTACFKILLSGPPLICVQPQILWCFHVLNVDQIL